MKLIRTVLILGAIAFLIYGCGGEKSARTVKIGCDEFTQNPFIIEYITINSGEDIIIELCSNPTTGFQWSENPDNTNPKILSQESHDFLIQGEEGSSLPPGTPGYEIWRFTGKDPGQSQLYFEYSRNWEGGEKGVWTYTLLVTVQ